MGCDEQVGDYSMSQARSLSVIMTELPHNLTALLGFAKLMGVSPNITARLDKLGVPTDRDVRRMYAVSLAEAIARQLQKQEIDNGDHN